MHGSFRDIKCQQSFCIILQEDTDESTADPDSENLTKLEPAPSKPGMVARLLELKRRRQQQANGKL